MFTGIKNIDYEIFNYLDDEDLVNVFQINKLASGISNENLLWLNRIRMRFPYIPQEVLKKYFIKLHDNSWKKYYTKDLTKLTSNANNLLITSCRDNRLDYALIALNNGADVNCNDFYMDGYGDTTLMIASHIGHIDMVKLLLNHRANPNLTSKVHPTDTPLLYAIERGHKDIARLLLDHEANVNMMHRYAGTHLMYACRLGHREIVEMLLSEYNADVNVIDECRYTALTWAVRKCPSNEVKNIVNILLKFNINVNVKDSSGITALAIASSECDVNLVRMLIENGANVNIGDITPLIIASRCKRIDVVRVLLENGADIDVTDNDGETALSVASKKNYTSIVKLLHDYVN